MSLTMRAVLRRLEMTPRFGRLLRTLAAAAAMGAVTWLARAAGTPLFGLVLVAAAQLPGVAFALRALTPAQLRAVLRRKPL